MISQHETWSPDVWGRLAAPIPQRDIAWRQDGRPIARDGKFFARFVAYIEATTVRERLDSVVPGEWNLTLESLPSIIADVDGVEERTPFAFKARLQILGVVREDVGVGKDYKQASTDAFKRAAVRFGIGHELYEYEQNWVPMDGDGKYAKPLQDPGEAYEQKMERKGTTEQAPRQREGEVQPVPQGHTPPALPFSRGLIATDVPPCPKCGGRVWDNRIGKKNPKAPDFKCRDRSCDGVIWPPKNQTAPAPESVQQAVANDPDWEPVGGDSIPF